MEEPLENNAYWCALERVVALRGGWGPEDYEEKKRIILEFVSVSFDGVRMERSAAA